MFARSRSSRCESHLLMSLNLNQKARRSPAFQRRKSYQIPVLHFAWHSHLLYNRNFAHAFHQNSYLVGGTVVAGTAIFYGSVGLALGDLLSGLLSQALKSRKKAVLVCLAVAFICMCLYLFVAGLSVNFIYGICFVLGMAVGYWAVLITMAAEQFGTNIRGTVTTTVPNFVRGSAVLCTLGFLKLKQTFAVSQSAFYVGLICFLLAGWALYRLQETYGKDLNYLE